MNLRRISLLGLASLLLTASDLVLPRTDGAPSPNDEVLPLQFEKHRHDAAAFQGACRELFDRTFTDLRSTGAHRETLLGPAPQDSMEGRAVKLLMAAYLDSFEFHGDGCVSRIDFKYPSYSIHSNPEQITLEVANFSGSVWLQLTNVTFDFTAQVPESTELDRLNQREQIHFEAALILRPKYHRTWRDERWTAWQPMAPDPFGAPPGVQSVPELHRIAQTLRSSRALRLFWVDPWLGISPAGGRPRPAMPMNPETLPELRGLPGPPGTTVPQTRMLLMSDTLRKGDDGAPFRQIFSWKVRLRTVRRPNGETQELWSLSDAPGGIQPGIRVARARFMTNGTWKALLSRVPNPTSSFLGPDSYGLDPVAPPMEEVRAMISRPNRPSLVASKSHRVDSITNHVLLGLKPLPSGAAIKLGQSVSVKAEAQGLGNPEPKWTFHPSVGVQPGNWPAWNAVVEEQVTTWIATPTREGDSRPGLNLSSHVWTVQSMQAGSNGQLHKQESTLSVNPLDRLEVRIDNFSAPCAGTLRLVLTNLIGSVSVETALRLENSTGPDSRSPSIPFPMANRPIYRRADAPRSR